MAKQRKMPFKLITGIGIFFIVLAISVSQFAWAHKAAPATGALAIRHEQFSDNTLKTGDQQVIRGEIHNLSSEPIKVSLSLSAETSPTNIGNRWTVVNQEPAGEEILIPPSDKVQYALTAKWLKPGTYHVHTTLKFGDFLNWGSVLGPGQTTVVNGDSIYQNSEFELPAIAGLLAAGGIVAMIVMRRRNRSRKT
jgi:hypothetical protein